MATVRLQKSIFDETFETFSVEDGTTIEQIIRTNTDGNTYEGALIECYDLDTGKTYYAAIEDNTAVTNAIVMIDGKSVGLDYKVQETDIVGIVITPAGGGGGGGSNGWDWFNQTTGALVGALGGALAGGIIGATIGLLAAGPAGVVVGFGFGLVIGALAGTVVGYMAGVQAEKNRAALKNGTSDSGLDSNKLPDVRGASNQPITDNVFPFVLGKHLTTPFIIGSTWNEITGDRGQTNYIHCLYTVGYAPLRLTDFKLGDMFLAHNQRWNEHTDMKNIFHGALTGTDDGTPGSGDIVNTWHNNDITLEILQQGQNGEAIDWGNVYPWAKVQHDINANVLYIADGTLVDIDNANTITYKGLGLANGLRNNPIRFSEQYPKSLKVELDLSSGLHRSRSEKSGDNSRVIYSRIPVWVAIQWRVYSDYNDKCDGSDAGTGSLPEYDYTKKVYNSNKRYWNSFSVINGNINAETFDQTKRNRDIDYHTGNDLKRNGYTDINTGWYGASVFNLEPLGGTNEDREGINEIRCITQVDLIEWARQNLCTEQERDNETILAEKIKAYFYDASNSTNSVEVRVVRISPCYLDETVSTQDHSAYKFTDVFSWTTLTSEVIDGDKLKKDNIIEQLRPIPDEWMRKLCVVSLKAKTDNVDQLTNTVKKFSCVAQSFAPYYDKELKQWVPTNVEKTIKYKRPDGTEITKEQFEADRQAEPQIKSKAYPAGNDFVSNLVTNVIRINDHKDSSNRYFIPYDDKENDNYLPGCDGTLRYCTNNVASMFLLAGIGPHIGVDALGYEQEFYDNGTLKASVGDFNMSSLAKWHEWAKEVVDGSTYSSTGHHFDYEGKQQYHEKGDIVKVFYAANAYIYQAEQLETLLGKIVTAGRSVLTKDNKGRFTIIIDKPEEYPVALINQQNTISSSYTISFNELPSGLQMVFPDENDGYFQNQFYCMADGEDPDHPNGAIEQYSFPFVTNREQQFSLGRYLLANRLLNKEVVTKKMGIEGYSIGLGSVILLQDDTMLIGTDNGARISKLIEDANLIYGFIINNTFKYTGEEEEFTDSGNNTQTRCKQGVVIMQPGQYKESRIITIRLAKNNTSRLVDGELYVQSKGDTNIVLFDVPVAKDSGTQDGSEYYIYKPEVDNIVGFGIIGKETAKFRVIKVKPDSKHNFEFTLLRYNENIYNFGKELPSFQNTMTIPDRSGDDSFDLSASPTNNDLMNAVANTIQTSSNAVMSSFAAIPPVPTNFRITPQKDFIMFTCNTIVQNINNIDHVEYIITRPDNSEVVVKGGTTAYYYFDRSVDGYPEKSDFSNDWSFGAKTVAMYTDEHGVSPSSQVVTGTLDLDKYGTWHIPDITVSKEVIDRTAVMTAVHSANVDVYGTEQTLVKIKRVGNIEPVTSGVPHPTFNELLGITPDGYFLEPEFDKAVEYTETGDNEDNYCKRYPEVTTMPGSPQRGDVVRYIGETTQTYTQYNFYRYNGTEWKEYSIDFVSTANKITHTVPLIGQTKRLFRQDGTYTGIFEKDVPEVESMSELPHDPPEEGDVIKWTGDTRTTDPKFEENAFYLYENATWEKCTSKANMVQTHYVYSFRMTNESGYVTNEVLVDIYAKSTGIADLVHSHEHYKNLYVEKLSAINANLGMISQGGMGSFNDMLNCWALSDLSAEDSGVPGGVMKGTFRVGDNKEYFRVTPIKDPDFPDDPSKRSYKIELKAGNIELSTDISGDTSMDFQNGTFIYTSDKSSRMKLTPQGIYVQKLVKVTLDGTENPNYMSLYEYDSINRVYTLTPDTTVIQGKDYFNWQDISKVYTDPKGNMIISNSDKIPDFGFPVNGAVYHFEDSTHKDWAESETNPQNITVTGNLVSTERDPSDPMSKDPMILGDSSKLCLEGTIVKNIGTFDGRVVFLSKAEGIEVDRQIHIDGTVTPTVETYNSEMREAKGGGTVGSYLGLTSSQISTGIFEEA